MADCNLKESKISKTNSDITKLRCEIELLENFIRVKGFNFTIKNNSIYELGYEPCGSDHMASYEKRID